MNRLLLSRQAASAQLTEPRLGPGLQQAELRFSQFHLSANHLLRFFAEIEANQNLAVATRKTFENAIGEVRFLTVHYGIFGISAEISDNSARLQFRHLIAIVNYSFDIRGNLTPHHGSDETHQAVRFAQFTAPDRLYNNYKTVVYFVVQVLRAELPADLKFNAPRKNSIQFFERRGIVRLNARD
jgi:hypothetical protein